MTKKHATHDPLGNLKTQLHRSLSSSTYLRDPECLASEFERLETMFYTTNNDVDLTSPRAREAFNGARALIRPRAGQGYIGRVGAMTDDEWLELREALWVLYEEVFDPFRHRINA